MFFGGYFGRLTPASIEYIPELPCFVDDMLEVLLIT